LRTFPCLEKYLRNRFAIWQIFLLVVFFFLSLGARAIAEYIEPLSFDWRRSLPVEWMSPATGPIGGTETRALVPFNGKLYAAMGYWSDSQLKNLELPGAQVLVLDSAKSEWKVDLELPERVSWDPLNLRVLKNWTMRFHFSGCRKYLAVSMLSAVKFTRDLDGNSIPPVSILIAGVWLNGGGATEVFYKTDKSGKWVNAVLDDGTQYHPVRSFTVYEDKATQAQQLLAGFGWKEHPGIYSGRYDPRMDRLVWDKKPELLESKAYAKQPKDDLRVTSFVECNGKLYASVYDRLYERQDGKSPIWKVVFEHHLNSNSGRGTGFRGLTAIPAQGGKGGRILFTVEDDPLVILSVDPLANFECKEDLNVSGYLAGIWKTTVKYGVAAYNNMLVYPYPSKEAPSLFIGFEIVTPKLDETHRFKYWNANANFLIRHADGKYELREIFDPALAVKPKLVSTRTLALSPFPGDPPGTLYAGGFDGNYLPVHNTAWIYKGVPR